MNLISFDSLSEPILTAMKAGHVRCSFSQLGEDGVLWWIFADRRNGFYVDVGCHHPFRLSNTAALHIYNDWRGINIDVDERAIRAFQQARPDDVNLCLAIAGSSGEMEVAFFEEGAVNSLDPAMSSSAVWAPLLKEKRMVQVHPLREVLLKYVPAGQQIDFLNIDAEGLDYEILASNDFSLFRPEAIAVEVHGFDMSNPREDKAFSLLTDHGYALISHVAVTSIYRRQ